MSTKEQNTKEAAMVLIDEAKDRSGKVISALYQVSARKFKIVHTAGPVETLPADEREARETFSACKRGALALPIEEPVALGLVSLTKEMEDEADAIANQLAPVMGQCLARLMDAGRTENEARAIMDAVLERCHSI